MRELKLSKSDKVALVDDSDYESVSKYTWRYSVRDGYPKRSTFWWPEGVAHSRENEKIGSQFLHQFLMGKPPEGMQIDHKNRNRLDNRRENLRFCTRSQNQQNCIRHSVVSKSGYRGVHQWKNTKTWVARICCNYKRTEVGGFATAEEAALHYNKMAIELHGEFATLNIVSPL